ncbi:two-partner secretion domain-containing protein [Sulfurospirillum arsenophilum]|uniref:two-partner secretion domain-containing protein n=1 Tax=Sulfurospirillum arsenophilum TaxID=56698 RepID=UPI0005A5FDEE|nr:hemagglutinin repeat-containing protein [Sulfurospirillum arsenophilum]
MTSKQVVSIIINIFLVLNQTITAAELTVDTGAPKGNQAELLKAPNGVPIVNIVTPNSQGLSHNKFSNFNVDPQGLILNNSKTIANTQLAGYISYNPNLTGNNAKLILNEVTGTSKTLLRGYTEIAGVAADVIVANPNGISVNGGGFINTPNATLTTATPIMDGNLVQGFNVGGGSIIFEGDGFNGNNIAKVNLYAKALQLNAKLYADELHVVTGENNIALDGTVTSQNKSGSGISIDSSVLGGIYANTITLKSTDKGIGVNLPPEVLAQNSLELTSDGSIVASKVVAGTKATLTSQSANVNLTNDITANTIELNAGKKLSIATDKVIEAASDMTIVVENISNKGELSALSGTGKSSITALQNIDNEGLIGGYDVDVKANSIDNTGAIYSKNNLAITAQTLDNSGLIRSNKTMDLLVKNSLTNQKEGVIYSDDTLNIAANSAKDKINTVTNEGLIQSEKNINITAQTLTNTANAPVMKEPTSSSTITSGGGNNFDVITTNIYQKVVDVPSAPALIIANGDINLNVGTLNNVYSLISSDGNIVLNATLVNNIGVLLVTTTDIITSQYREEKKCKRKPWKSCSHYAAYRGTFTQSETIKNPIANYGIQAKKSITGNVVTLNNISSSSNPQIQAKLTTIDNLEGSSKSLQSLTKEITSTNDSASELFLEEQTLTDTLTNLKTLDDLGTYKTELAAIKTDIQDVIIQNSTSITSLESVISTIKTLNSKADTSTLETTITTLKDNYIKAKTKLDDFETLYTSLTVVADAQTKKTDVLTAQTALNDLLTQNTTALQSVSVEPITTGLESISNTLRAEVNTALAQQGNGEFKIITANEGLYQTNTHNALLQTQAVKYTANSSTIIDNITLPKGKYGTFLVNKTKNHPFLIEANPLFTNYNTFISSDYMLKKLDYRPENTLKRLGDAMYETQLVSNSVIRLSGSRYLEGYGSELAQFQGLMDNAINVQSTLNLKMGISLSPEQIARLNKNIVWMVEKVIDGETILVPEVYLASNNITSDGAKIAAGEIDLVIQDTLLNEGLIASEGTLKVATGKTLTNQNGAITSGGTMALTSGGALKNLSGTIQSGGDMSLTAQSITSTALTQDKTYNYGQGYQTTTQKGKAAQFTSGGNLVMQTNDDITLANTNTQATGNIALTSTNGAVNIEALETKENYDFQLKNGYNRGNSIKQNVSTMEGKNIAINANQVNVIASNMSASENIILEAKEGVNILAANDLTYQDTKITTKTKGFMGGKQTKQDTTYKENAIQSKLNANNILIKADTGSATLEAANLIAKENIVVDAKQDINVLAKQYREGEMHSTTKSSWGGLSKSASMDRTDALNAKAAQLRTEALNIIMKSGNDIKVIGSNIDAASDLQLQAANEVLIAAAQEFSQSEQWSKKSSFNLGNMLTSLATLGLAKTGPVYESEFKQDDKTQVKAKSSNINSGNNIIIDSGSAKVIGSNLEAEKTIQATTNTGSIEVLSAEETTKTNSVSKKTEVSLGNIVKMAESIQKVVNPLPGQEQQGTKIKISVAKATYDNSATSTERLTHKSSSLTSKSGDIVMDSKKDIMVDGSKLEAAKTVSLTTKEGDVTIKESIDTYNENSKEKHASADISITVQNEYAEIGSAVKAAAESAKQLKKVKEDYSKYKDEVSKLESTLSDVKARYKAKEAGIDFEDIGDLNDLIDNVKDNEKYYLAAIAAATVDLASKTVAIYAQTATAAASSATWGFSVGLALDLKGSQLVGEALQTQSLASSIYGNDIIIKTNTATDTTTTISGSNVVAENTLGIQTHDLLTKSSIDTSTSKQDSKDLSGTLSMTMYGGGSGMGASLGYGEGHQTSDSTTNRNAELLANNINITTTNDASFKGATVRADDTLNVKVGGDLSVESQRDSSSSNSKGFNVSVSASLGKDKDYTANEKNYENKKDYYNAQDKLNNTVGARVGDGLGSTGASFGASTGTNQSKQTVLTSLTGENVNVEVGGNTHIKGALIAAGETNEQGVFEDNEKLKLKTDTLTFANSSNTEFSSSNSFNVGTNIGFETKTNAQTNVEEATTKVNSSSLSLSNQMGYSGSKTLATVGKGDVQVGDTENSDDLTRLNRDTTKVNKELYSGSVGTSVTAVLDHRFLSEDGWKLIAQDFVKTGMMLDTINQVVGNQTVGLSEFGAELRKREITYETVKERIAQDKDLAAVLNSPAYTDDQKKAIINGITKEVMVELGYKPIETVLIATTEPGRDGYQVKGYFSLETGKAYINDFYNNTNADLLTTAGTEAQRAIDAQKGSNFDQSKEYRDARSEYSQNFGGNIKSYADFALYFTGQGSLSTGTNSISTPSQTQNNNAEFAGLNKELGDNSTYVQKLPDGKYKVVQVNLKDNDKSIYVVNDKGELVGEKIGESLFIDSFYYADEGGTSATRPRGIIDLTSKEGIDFLKNKIYTDTPSISSYMNEWKNYNFKDIGATKYPPGQERADYTYRGSQIYPDVYASARDFGNIGAGYVAGYGLMPWSLSKFAFERFQAKQNGNSFGDGTEIGQSTSAQFLGWEKGNQAISNKLQD